MTRLFATMNKEKMINRVVKFGMNRNDAIVLLDDVLSSFSDQNLPGALSYNDFITSYTASKLEREYHGGV